MSTVHLKIGTLFLFFKFSCTIVTITLSEEVIGYTMSATVFQKKRLLFRLSISENVVNNFVCKGKKVCRSVLIERGELLSVFVEGPLTISHLHDYKHLFNGFFFLPLRIVQSVDGRQDSRMHSDQLITLFCLSTLVFASNELVTTNPIELWCTSQQNTKSNISSDTADPIICVEKAFSSNIEYDEDRDEQTFYWTCEEKID